MLGAVNPNAVPPKSSLNVRLKFSLIRLKPSSKILSISARISSSGLSSYNEREELTVKTHNLEMALTKIDSDLEYLRIFW